MSKIGTFIKNINKMGANNDKIKFLNFVATSDSDDSYLRDNWKKTAKILRAIYILIIFIFVFISFLPLFFDANEQTKISQSAWFTTISVITFFVLLADYLFRWITFPFRASKMSVAPLFFFPITGTSLLMLLSMLPITFSVFSAAIPADNPFVKLINVFSIVKIIRLLMLLKIVKTFSIFTSIFQKNKTLLINVFVFLIIMALIFALVIYSVEGVEKVEINANGEETKVPTNPGITNYWDALYFTFITITTIGYGDISPQTDIGRTVVIMIAIIGIVIFSIPSGIITGSFIVEIQEMYKRHKKTPKEREIEKLSFAEKMYLKTLEKAKKLVDSKDSSTILNYEKMFIITGEGINKNSSVLFDKLINKIDEDNLKDFSFSKKSFKIIVNDDRNINDDFFKLIELLNLEVEEKAVSEDFVFENKKEDNINDDTREKTKDIKIKNVEKKNKQNNDDANKKQ